MGDYYVKLIPFDPNFVPKKETLDKLEGLLPVLKTWALEVNIINKDQPIFIDQGQYFDSISCPFCNQQLDTEWWHKAINKASLTNFLNLKTLLPCCRKIISLNDLDYVFPAGFARFAIELLEPGLMEDDEVEWLQQQLGFKLKRIEAKY